MPAQIKCAKNWILSPRWRWCVIDCTALAWCKGAGSSADFSIPTQNHPSFPFRAGEQPTPIQSSQFHWILIFAQIHHYFVSVFCDPINSCLAAEYLESRVLLVLAAGVGKPVADPQNQLAEMLRNTDSHFRAPKKLPYLH